MVTLTALDPRTYEIGTFELPLAQPGDRCTLAFRALPGARRAQLLLTGIAPARRIEVKVEGTERHSLKLELDGSGQLQVRGAGRAGYVLLPECPPDDPLRLALPLFPPAAAVQSLGLVILVDGTAHMLRDHTDAGTGDPALPAARAWGEHVARLAALAEGVAQGAQTVRYLVMGYGDGPLPYARAADLKPSWNQPLWPDNERQRRQFRPFDPQCLARDLSAIDYTPGGDFIDALGEALYECNNLFWDEFDRRVLIVSGDSPGFSVLYELGGETLPAGANGALRRCDVDTELFQLHNRQVEILSVYQDHSEPEELRPETRLLLEYAKNQFRDLASSPDLHQCASALDPQALARTFLERTEPVARLSALAVNLGIYPGSRARS